MMKMEEVFEILKKVRNKDIKLLVFAESYEEEYGMILHTSFDCSSSLWEIEEEYRQIGSYKNSTTDIVTRKDGMKRLFKYLRASSVNSDFYLSYTE